MKVLQRFYRNTRIMPAVLASVGLVVTVVLYGILLAHDGPSQDAHGQADAYYRDAVQFQIAFERTSAQLLRYGSGADKDLQLLQDLNVALQAKFRDLQQHQPGGHAAADMHDQVVKFAVFLDEFDEALANLPNDPRIASDLIPKFEKRLDAVDSFVEAYGRAVETNRHATLTAQRMDRINAYIFLQLVLWPFIGCFWVQWKRTLTVEEQIEEQNAIIKQGQEAAEKAKDAILTEKTILATVSHELRTPLHTILHGIDSLDVRNLTPKQRSAVDRMLVAGQQLESQMRDMLDFARLDVGKLQLRPEILNPSEVVGKLLASLQHSAQRKGLRLITDLGSSKLEVILDRTRFQQIVTNLVTNAIKYTDTGKITVKVFVLNEGSTATLRLTVEDTGPGIPEEAIPTLFDAFKQVDQGNTRRYDGAGMGLAIVKGLVERMGGKVWVQSKLGAGARFEVRIPVEIAADPHADVNSYRRAASPMRALIVDDHQEILDCMSDDLEMLGYQPETAGSGTEALQKTSGGKYAVIFLDIQMPGMDGFEVVNHLRANDGPNRKTPVIAISGRPEDLNTPEQRQMFIKYLTKGHFRRNDIQAALEEVTALRTLV